MNAVDYIRERVDIRRVMEHYNFRNLSETEDAFRACCAIHGGDNPTSFVWMKHNKLWYCYTGAECGGGDIFNLVEKMEGLSFRQSITKASQILGINIAGMEMDFHEDNLRREQQRWIESQMKRRKKTSLQAEEYVLPATEYSRECDDANAERLKSFPLEHYGAEFCKLYPTKNREGKDVVLHNKLMIPIRQKGKLRAVALRDTTGTFSAKWMYQPDGIKTHEMLYNIDKVTEMIENEEAEEVILVEGIFDVWAYHRIGIDNVVAIFGSSLGESQYKELLKLNVLVTCSFDSDDAGKKCTAKVLEQMKNKCDVKVIELPEGKDPDDCTEEELLNAYLNRGYK